MTFSLQTAHETPSPAKPAGDNHNIVSVSGSRGVAPGEGISTAVGCSVVMSGHRHGVAPTGHPAQVNLRPVGSSEAGTSEQATFGEQGVGVQGIPWWQGCFLATWHPLLSMQRVEPVPVYPPGHGPAKHEREERQRGRAGSEDISAKGWQQQASEDVLLRKTLPHAAEAGLPAYRRLPRRLRDRQNTKQGCHSRRSCPSTTWLACTL